MPTSHKKKLIEVALPLAAINEASAYDKMPGIGAHPKGIHHWWARLPLPAARAILFASLIDDPSSDPEAYPDEPSQEKARQHLFGIIEDAVSKDSARRAAGVERMAEQISISLQAKSAKFIDPFSGGGSIPLEAGRLGLDVIANDLNPVAALLNRINLELVPAWMGQAAISSQGFARSESPVAGLAGDIEFYGQLVLDRVRQKIGEHYPPVALSAGSGSATGTPIAYIWARTVQSPNPAANGKHVPLVKNFVLASKGKRKVWVDPVIDPTSQDITFHIRSSGAPSRTGTVNRRGATCILTGTPIPFDYIRDEGRAGRIGMRLMAVVAQSSSGRIYLPADQTQELAATCPVAENAPDSDLPEQALGFRVQNYGYKRHSDLFTNRQLLSLVSLSDEVKAVENDIRRQALARGMTEQQASKYAAAIQTFLALAIDRLADFNCGFSTWKPSGEQQMHLFTRQAIPMAWDFAEANVLGDRAICWKNAVTITAEAVESIPLGRLRAGRVTQASATEISGIDNVPLIVSTDPPYYDNIAYADLSDFFYVWLRRTVGHIHNDLFRTLLTPKKAELVAAPEKFAGDRELAKRHFEEGFRSTFTGIAARMDPSVPMTVYYAFKQGSDGEEDDNSDDDLSTSSIMSGWESLLSSMISSGFQITATWPISASQKWRMRNFGSNALTSYIVLACRKRADNGSTTTRATFLRELKRELPAAIRVLQADAIAPVDLAQAAIGPGMAIFSRYARVLGADDRPITVRAALQDINAVLDSFLSEQDSDYDGHTRFAVTWFEDLGMASGPYGKAETLAVARGVSVPGVRDAGIVESGGGKVRLLRRDELASDWSPADDNHPTVWECTQHLVRRLLDDSEDRAAALVGQLGDRAEPAKDLAYRLYGICERKKWADEGYGYNALVASWPRLIDRAKALKVSPTQSELAI